LRDQAGMDGGREEQAAAGPPAPRKTLGFFTQEWTPPHQRRTHKVSHVLAAGLRRRILSGDLEAGRRLPAEAELTATLGVSRDTLREALRILESQSLIEIRRGRGGGAVVRQPGLDSVGQYVALLLQVRQATLADLQEARWVIEPPAAARFALEADQGGLDRLAVLHVAERAATGDALSFAAAVAAFDQAVTELSGCISVGVIAGVLRHIYQGQVYSVADAADPGQAEEFARRVLAAHDRFLDAARRRDGARARQVWSGYLGTPAWPTASPDRDRLPIDVVPMWKAQASNAGGDSPQRAAAVVVSEIRSRIADGRLGDGERLPPLPALMEEFGLSLPTMREALRILEMELLIDLRPGDRGGATVRHPSPRVAAQLAGTVLQARGTTLADYYAAVRMTQPAMMEIAATRIGPGPLQELRARAADVAASTGDTPQFMKTWRSAAMVAFAGTRNPALAVVAEMMEWVQAGTESVVSADAASLRGVTRSNRRAAARFADLVSAFAARDAAGALSTWTACLEAGAPLFESSGLGRRLVVDLID
jgi:DNA-binding FadR family transcriptional regulator